MEVEDGNLPAKWTWAEHCTCWELHLKTPEALLVLFLPRFTVKGKREVILIRF